MPARVRLFPARMSPWLLALLLLAAAYGFFALFAWLAADQMLFQPRSPSYDATLPGLARIPARDGTTLAGVHLPHPDAVFTILYFHGNAEDLGDLYPHLNDLHDHGFAVFAMDYRGYGLSGGAPGEQSVYADAEAVFAYVTEQLRVPAGRVILYGRSLGSGPAVELAARHPVAGMIIENGFVSAFRTVTRVTLLPWDRFRNLARMPQVHCPVLVVHGRRDRTVPFSHGRRLFTAAREPKRALWVDDAGHNDVVETAGGRYWEALAAFAKLIEGGRSG